MPKAFTQQEKEWIQACLLEQGERLFAAFGLRKTSVEELADGAGISKGAFYLFYPSKEALFMDVIERAEEAFREEVLAAIDLPGPSPRARLLRVLHTALTLWKTIPLLQFFTQSEYQLLARKMPEDKLQEHLRSDQEFTVALIQRCQEADIPIQAPPDELSGLLHAAFFVSLHEDDFGAGSMSSTIVLLLDLIAAYCLGEVTLQTQALIDRVSAQMKG